jgi:hypothetical protein
MLFMLWDGYHHAEFIFLFFLFYLHISLDISSLHISLDILDIIVLVFFHYLEFHGNEGVAILLGGTCSCVAHHPSSWVRQPP